MDSPPFCHFGIDVAKFFRSFELEVRFLQYENCFLNSDIYSFRLLIIFPIHDPLFSFSETIVL